MNNITIRAVLVFSHGSAFQPTYHTMLPCRPIPGDFYEPTPDELVMLKKKFNKAYNGDDNMMNRWVVKGCEFLGQMFVVKLRPTKAEI